MTRRLTTFWHLVLSFSFASTLALSGLGAADTEAGAGIARNAQPASTTRVGAHYLLWVGWKDCASLSDAQLKQWKARGAAGFVCQTDYLNGMGGTQAFTGDLGSDLNASSYALERTLAASTFASRARALGMTAFLGFYLVNYENVRTPLAEWFDDAAWSQTVLPDVRGLGAAAKALGFGGVAFDQELYTQKGPASTASWNWDYPGNVHGEQAVRKEVSLRGQQLMTALLQGFPGVSIVAYNTLFPGTWDALVQQVGKGLKDPYGQTVQTNFWDGLTRVDGYRRVLFLDASFYKQTGISGASWNAALQYQQNSFFSVLSQQLSNWSYAWSRIDESPFAWIDGDVAHEGSYAAPRSTSYVAKQLGAFEQWTMDGTYGIYAYNPLSQFDYGPYVPALRKTARAKDPRPSAPGLTVLSASRRGAASETDGTVVIHGYATDRDAVRAVYWRDGPHQGAAVMRWQRQRGDDTAGWQWRMNWVIRAPVATGVRHIRVVAVSTSGSTTSRTVQVPG